MFNKKKLAEFLARECLFMKANFKKFIAVGCAATSVAGVIDYDFYAGIPTRSNTIEKIDKKVTNSKDKESDEEKSGSEDEESDYDKAIRMSLENDKNIEESGGEGEENDEEESGSEDEESDYDKAIRMSLVNGGQICSICRKDGVCDGTCERVYGIDNGLIGLNRDVVMRLIRTISTQPNSNTKVVNLVGTCQEICNWKNQRIFSWARKPVINDTKRRQSYFRMIYKFVKEKKIILPISQNQITSEFIRTFRNKDGKTLLFLAIDSIKYYFSGDIILLILYFVDVNALNQKVNNETPLHYATVQVFNEMNSCLKKTTESSDFWCHSCHSYHSYHSYPRDLKMQNLIDYCLRPLIGRGSDDDVQESFVWLIKEICATNSSESESGLVERCVDKFLILPKLKINAPVNVGNSQTLLNLVYDHIIQYGGKHEKLAIQLREKGAKTIEQLVREVLNDEACVRFLEYVKCLMNASQINS
ncbi:hypothetical protein FACS189465_2470 [Clostridia bacterium]|nr:hypothetical protein FACS189465_2470 [Clostridia bacterium]